MRRALVPLVAGLFGLLGSLAVTAELYAAASTSLQNVLDVRLRGVGESAALLLQSAPPPGSVLRQLQEANQLDGVYLLSPKLEVLADAAGEPRPRVDLLRVDPARLGAAFQGKASVGRGYALGDLEVTTAYFPVPPVGAGGGDVRAVLALEAGKAFAEPRSHLTRALWGGIALSVLGALALAVVAGGWARSERKQAQVRDRAARAEVLSKMAAMAAHEIRNPLAVIRATVELMRERLRSALTARDEQALQDVLGEVERLRVLTEDLMDLAADRPLNVTSFDLRQVLDEAARAAQARYPAMAFEIRADRELPMEGDPGRLRQVFLNLLMNASQAQGQGTVHLEIQQDGPWVAIAVHDEGPGVPAALRERLFDPFVTTRSDGTGLGLALSKRLVERHGGTLCLVDGTSRGARFEIRLPTPVAAALSGG